MQDIKRVQRNNAYILYYKYIGQSPSILFFGGNIYYFMNLIWLFIIVATVFKISLFIIFAFYSRQLGMEMFQCTFL